MAKMEIMTKKQAEELNLEVTRLERRMNAIVSEREQEEAGWWHRARLVFVSLAGLIGICLMPIAIMVVIYFIALLWSWVVVL